MAACGQSVETHRSNQMAASHHSDAFTPAGRDIDELCCAHVFTRSGGCEDWHEVNRPSDLACSKVGSVDLNNENCRFHLPALSRSDAIDQQIPNPGFSAMGEP